MLFTISLNAQNAEDKVSLMTNIMCDCVENYGDEINEKKFERCLKKLFRKNKKDLDTIVNATFKHDTILPKAFVAIKAVTMLSESLVDNCSAYTSFYEKLQRDNLISEISDQVCDILKSNEYENIESNIFDLSDDIFTITMEKKDVLREVLKGFTSKEDKYREIQDLQIEVRKSLSKKCRIYKKIKRKLD